MTGSLHVKNGKYYAVLNIYEDGQRKQKWITTGLAVKGNKRLADRALEAIKSEYLENVLTGNHPSKLFYTNWRT